MQHRNAPLTPNGRLRMVRLVEEQGLTFEAAAAASNVAKSTAWTWVRRWRAGEPEQRALAAPALRIAPRRPRRSPAGAGRRPTRAHLRAASTHRLEPAAACRARSELPHSTVHRVLRRGGCSRRPQACAAGGRPLRVALPRQPAAHGHKALRALRSARPRRHRRPHRTALARERAGWSTCTRSSTTARAWPIRRSTPTSARQPSPPSPAARSTASLDQGIVAERLMTDNHFSYMQQPLAARAARRARDPAHPHPALHAAHQRQGRALQPDAAARVGLRARIRLKRCPPRGAATLDRPLQRAPHPLGARRPPAPCSRSGRPRARQLAHQPPAVAGWLEWAHAIERDVGAGDAGPARLLGHRGGDRLGHPAVEDARDDVLLGELLVGNHVGDGVRRGELHLLGDLGRARVERAAEDAGEGRARC